MRGIITVVGKDQVGIIAKICSYLSENGINILDISQTILSGFFNMMMIVEIGNMEKDLELVEDELVVLGEKIGVVIKLQREDIFNIMHRI